MCCRETPVKCVEKYKTSHTKLERFEVKSLTPTKDVNVVYTVKRFVFSVLHLVILIGCRPLKLLIYFQII